MGRATAERRVPKQRISPVSPICAVDSGFAVDFRYSSTGNQPQGTNQPQRFPYRGRVQPPAMQPQRLMGPTGHTGTVGFGIYGIDSADQAGGLPHGFTAEGRYLADVGDEHRRLDAERSESPFPLSGQGLHRLAEVGDRVAVREGALDAAYHLHLVQAAAG